MKITQDWPRKWKTGYQTPSQKEWELTKRRYNWPPNNGEAHPAIKKMAGLPIDLLIAGCLRNIHIQICRQAHQHFVYPVGIFATLCGHRHTSLNISFGGAIMILNHMWNIFPIFRVAAIIHRQVNRHLLLFSSSILIENQNKPQKHLLA